MKKNKIEAVTVKTFWDDLIAAWNSGGLPESVFRIEIETQAPRQFMMWLEPSGAIVALQIFLRKAGREVSLNQKDIRDLLRLGWNKFITGKKRFVRNGPVNHAWGFEINEAHPLFDTVKNMEALPEHEKLGRIAYEGYREFSSFKEAKKLVGWEGLAVDAKRAWMRVARDVEVYVVRRELGITAGPAKFK